MANKITHRHPGKYRSNTSKGRVILKKRPTHSQNMRDKSYPQLKKEGYRIDKLKDYDGDGVINALDCKPLDVNRQDEWKNVKKSLKSIDDLRNKGYDPNNELTTPRPDLVQDKPKPTISTAEGTAYYVRTEVEDENGKWSDNYYIRDGYRVIHDGNKHYIYKIDEEEDSWADHERDEAVEEAENEAMRLEIESEGEPVENKYGEQRRELKDELEVPGEVLEWKVKTKDEWIAQAEKAVDDAEKYGVNTINEMKKPEKDKLREAFKALGQNVQF